MINFRRIPSAFSLVIWVVLWEIAGRMGSSDLLPPLSAIVASAFEIVQLPSFHRALRDTAQAFGLGMLLSVVVGIPFGVLMGTIPALARLANVWINIFVSAPTTALIPALMPLFGIGQATVVATVFLFAVWVIILDTQAGIKNVNPSLIAMSRAFGATNIQNFVKILLPAALPEIITGLRLGVVRGVKGVVIGQIVVSLLGFGALFETYLQSYSMIRFWALVLIVFALAFLVVALVEMLERRVDFYAASR